MASGGRGKSRPPGIAGLCRSEGRMQGSSAPALLL